MTPQAMVAIGALLVTHWMADFVFQSHYMASNKSKCNFIMTTHVAVYAGVMWLAACALAGKVVPGEFALFLFVTHWLTDYVTSRLTSRLWAKSDWHNFFVIVGLDQALHHTQILIAMWLWL